MFWRKKIIVSGAPGWYPVFMQYEGEGYYGVGVDVLEELKNRMNFEYEITTKYPWKRVFQMVDSGKIDFVIGTYYNAQREQENDFTFIRTPFMKNSVRVFVKKGKEFKFEKLEDLIDKKGGRPLGALYGEEYESFIKNNNIEIFETRHKDMLIRMVYGGRLDYFISDIYDVSKYLKKIGMYNDIVPLEKELKSFDVLYLISNKSPLYERLAEIEFHLQEMQKDGTLRKIISQYL